MIIVYQCNKTLKQYFKYQNREGYWMRWGAHKNKQEFPRISDSHVVNPLITWRKKPGNG